MQEPPALHSFVRPLVVTLTLLCTMVLGVKKMPRTGSNRGFCKGRTGQKAGKTSCGKVHDRVIFFLHATTVVPPHRLLGRTGRQHDGSRTSMSPNDKGPSSCYPHPTTKSILHLALQHAQSSLCIRHIVTRRLFLHWAIGDKVSMSCYSSTSILGENVAPGVIVQSHVKSLCAILHILMHTDLWRSGVSCIARDST